MKKTTLHNIRRKIYAPRTFLPNDRSEISDGPFRSIRHTSPVSINWHITSECSTDCKYCYLGRRKTKLLPFSRIQSLINEMSELDVFSIDLLGGDVLLYHNLVELLDMISECNFLPINLSTKSFLSKEKALQLKKFSNIIWELQFSIDTDDDQIAEYLVGIPDYTQRIFSSISNAIEVGLRVAAKSVITPYNVFTIPRLYRKLKNIGVSEIRLAAYSRSGFHHSDDLFLNDNCYKWLEEKVGE
ncbi:MAG: radical SAM protein [Planctomycetaceae bacterium]|nr:radical SAM protein [Planctomycetaceae bacterium]